jgi:ABC-type oligopeptide transport system substrate-binding subunit
MKKSKFFSLWAVGLVLFAACNNSSDGTSSTDSLNRDSNNTAGTNMTSSGNYAARADSVRANVTAGNYLNPRTGKAYTNLNVDANTGALTDETGHPVRRYVDKRTWWVYDTNSWDTVGSAQLRNGSLRYRGDNGDWLEYNKRWTDDMDDAGTTDMSTTSADTTSTSGTKVKVSDKGNKVKVKKTDPKRQ